MFCHKIRNYEIRYWYYDIVSICLLLFCLSCVFSSAHCSHTSSVYILPSLVLTKFRLHIKYRVVLYRTYLVLYRTYLVLYRTYLVLYRTYLVLYRTYLILYRTYLVLYRTCLVLYRTHLVLYRTDLVLYRTCLVFRVLERRKVTSITRI
jgi:hypothetical protein